MFRDHYGVRCFVQGVPCQVQISVPIQRRSLHACGERSGPRGGRVNGWSCTNNSNCQSRQYPGEGGVFRCPMHLNHAPIAQQSEEKSDSGKKKDSGEKNDSGKKESLPKNLEELIQNIFTPTGGVISLAKASESLQKWQVAGFEPAMTLATGSHELLLIKTIVEGADGSLTEWAKKSFDGQPDPTMGLNPFQTAKFAMIVKSLK